MSKTKGNVVDPLSVDRRERRRRAPVRPHPRGDARAATSGSATRGSRAPGTSPTSSGTRRGSSSGRGRRRSPPMRRAWPPNAALLGAAERWIRSRVAATTAAVDRAIADVLFARGDAGAVRRHLVASSATGASSSRRSRLADESLADEDREATWWTLVEALDTYLRLLHPVMPFVTEALWGALPHAADDPELLIVARWPAARATRDERARGRASTQVIELVRRSATPGRGRDRRPPAGCAIDVCVPRAAADDVRRARTGDRAADARATRSRSRRPRHAHGGVRPAALGDRRRRDRGTVCRPPSSDGQAARDRARLEKELARGRAAPRGGARSARRTRRSRRRRRRGRRGCPRPRGRAGRRRSSGSRSRLDG